MPRGAFLATNNRMRSTARTPNETGQAMEASLVYTSAWSRTAWRHDCLHSASLRQSLLGGLHERGVKASAGFQHLMDLKGGGRCSF